MVCFDNKFLVIFIIAIVIASFYYDYKRHLEVKAVHESYQDVISKKCPPCPICANSRPEIDNGNINTAYTPQQIDVNINEINQIPPIGMPMPPRMPHHGMRPEIIPAEPLLREYDIQNLKNPFMSPSHRASKNVIGDFIPSMYVGHGRDSGTWSGIIVNDDGKVTDNNKILQLFSRERYGSGSNNWEFHAILKGGGGKIKIPVYRQDGRKNELYTGDKVIVKALGDSVYKYIENDKNALDYD